MIGQFKRRLQPAIVRIAGNFSFGGVRSATRNSAYLLGTQTASILIRVVYILILVRWLTATEYGILNYAMSWYLAVISLTYLGADVVLGRQIARDKVGAAGLLWVTLKLRAWAIIAVAAVFLLLGFLAEDNDRIRPLLLILSLALVGRSFWMWGASVFTAFEETRLVFRLEVIFRSLEVIALTLFILGSKADLTGIALIHAASWCLQGATAFVAVSRRHRIGFDRKALKPAQVVREGIPGSIFAIAMASFFSLPIVLFRESGGVGDALGYFALAFQLIAYLQIIPYTIGSASLPVLSRSAARRDGKDQTAALLLMVMIPLAGVVLAAAVSLIATPMVETLFGERYGRVATLFAAGSWLIIPMSLAMLSQQLIFAHAVRSPLADGAPLLGLASMVALFPLMTDAMGVNGSLIAVAVGLGVWLMCATAELLRSGLFTPRQVTKLDKALMDENGADN